MHKVIADSINDEQILELACYAYSCCGPEEKSIEFVAERIIISYILKDAPDMESEEIQTEFEKLVYSQQILALTRRGILKADFTDDGEVEYTLNDEVRSSLEELGGIMDDISKDLENPEESD